MHKSGFVNILGRPNAGKSTLLNALLGEKISIVTPKAQTTRHRIIGLLNRDDSQIVFSDTPGIIFEPMHKLHKAMMRAVFTAMEDADVILFITDVFEKETDLASILDKIIEIKTPKILIINKIDLAKKEEIEVKMKAWKARKIFDEVVPLSALKNEGTEQLVALVLKYLPEHPPFFPKDELTDRNVRYFVAEIIREKIFLNYRQEIPYACEVAVSEYKEDENIDRIKAEVYVERNSQKNILIGKKGAAMKQVGIEARSDIEKMVGKKVYLELTVKVREGWRNDDRLLKTFGYESPGSRV